MSEMKQPKRFKIETPVGSLESDSGNHIIDVASVVIVVLILYLGKTFIKRYIKWIYFMEMVKFR